MSDSGRPPFPVSALLGLVIFGALGWMVAYGTMPETKLGNPRFAGEYVMAVFLIGGMGMVVGAAWDGFRDTGPEGAGRLGGATLLGSVLGTVAGFKCVETLQLQRQGLDASILVAVAGLASAGWMLGLAVIARQRSLYQGETLGGGLVFVAVVLLQLSGWVGGFKYQPGSTVLDILYVLAALSMAMTLHGFLMERRTRRRGEVG